jgi:hypothetical protein
MLQHMVREHCPAGRLHMCRRYSTAGCIHSTMRCKHWVLVTLLLCDVSGTPAPFTQRGIIITVVIMSPNLQHTGTSTLCAVRWCTPGQFVLSP